MDAEGSARGSILHVRKFGLGLLELNLAFLGPVEGKRRLSFQVCFGGAAHEVDELTEVQRSRILEPTLRVVLGDQLKIPRHQLGTTMVAPYRIEPVAKPIAVSAWIRIFNRQEAPP